MFGRTDFRGLQYGGAVDDDGKENFLAHCQKTTVLKKRGPSDYTFAVPQQPAAMTSSSTIGRCFSTPYMDIDDTKANMGMPSPSPSPVFMDEDSHDSGYGCSQSKFDGFELIESRRKSQLSAPHSASGLKVWSEMQEDDEMEVDMIEQENSCEAIMNDDGSPFASLKAWKDRKSANNNSFKLKDSTNTYNSRRNPSFTSLKVPSSHFSRCRSESEVGGLTILQAIQKADENRNLIGDFTEGHALPLLKNPRVPDLKCISAQTVCDILDRKYENSLEKVVFLDCRYPYEYFGGHIKTALNIYTQDQLSQFLANNQNLKSGSLDENTNPTTGDNVKRRTVLLFYCEFSKERGPRMCRHLRATDRHENHCRYPFLDYPELYLIEGGYKDFFTHFQHHCEPRSYKPMDHHEHAEDLRKFRIKSKSWSSFAVAAHASKSATPSVGASPTFDALPARTATVRRGLFTQMENLSSD